MTDDRLMRHLAAGVDPDVALNREVVRHAVMKTITCQRTGAVLDEKRTVVVTVKHKTTGEAVSMYVLDGPAYDAVMGDLHSRVAALKELAVEVLDGRKLWS